MEVSKHSEDEEYSRVMTAKAVAMAVLFCSSMICGTLPLILAKKLKWFSSPTGADIKSRRPVVALLSFGGGVLLSTTFLHLLPEVDHNVVILQSNGSLPNFQFNLAPLLMCAGFFVMYLVEEAVHAYIERRERRAADDLALFRTLSVRRSQRGAPLSASTAGLIDSAGQLTVPVEPSKLEAGHSHLPLGGAEDEVVASLRGLLIVLALSVHELFEGLAVGLESSAQNVWYMFAAVSAHKLVIAFCIGVELIASKTRARLGALYVLTFAAVSPLGIGAGLLLVGGGGATGAGLCSVALQGLATGTLMYVVFFEVLSGDRSGLVQFAGALIGFLVMFGIQLAVPHSHSHDHSPGTDEHDHSHESAHGHGHSHGSGHGHSHDQ